MRAFIAIEVPEEVKERVLAVSERLKTESIVLVKKEAMHITLHFLGDITDSEAEKTKEAMNSVTRKPFEASLSGISCFTPNFIRVIFADVAEGKEEVSAIHRELSVPLSGAGIRIEREEFIPHLTIARVKYAADRGKLLDLIKRNSAAEFGAFAVDSIVLKKSLLSNAGPLYTELYERKL